MREIEIMRYTSTTARLAGAASILTLTSFLAASPVHAATTTTADALQHFIDCANWLVSDPAKHAANCNPGHDVFLSGSTGYSSTDPECAFYHAQYQNRG